MLRKKHLLEVTLYTEKATRVPRNVKRFAWLWVSSFLIQFPGVFLLPPSDAATHAAEQKLGLAGGLLLLAVLLPFLQAAVWRRKNWARWFLFAVFVICLPLLFVSPAFRPDYMLGTLLAFVSQLIEALGFYFAFTGDARPWFAGGNSKSATATRT